MNTQERATLMVEAAKANIHKLECVIVENNISRYSGNRVDTHSVSRIKANIRQIRQDLQDVSRMLDELA